MLRGDPVASLSIAGSPDQLPEPSAWLETLRHATEAAERRLSGPVPTRTRR